jgi:RNA polymerase sigma-70 factor (ECF subfamily)
MELDPSTILRAQRGERAALLVVLRRYAGPLHAFVRRVAPGEDVEDRVQELLSKLMTVLPRFALDGPASLSTWVFTVAHRWLLDDRKRRHLALAPLDAGLEVADPGPSAFAQVASRQVEQQLEQAIAALPDAQRRVFVLAHVHEHPLEEIAQVEGVPLGTVKSRLFRARATLAARLGPLLDRPQGVPRAG